MSSLGRILRLVIPLVWFPLGSSAAPPGVASVSSEFQSANGRVDTATQQPDRSVQRRLKFLRVPGRVSPGAPIEIVVAAVDSAGNRLDGVRGAIALRYEGPNDFRSTTFRSRLENGEARFEPFAISGLGSGYRIRVTAPGFAPLVSNSIDVRNALLTPLRGALIATLGALAGVATLMRRRTRPNDLPPTLRVSHKPHDDRPDVVRFSKHTLTLGNAQDIGTRRQQEDAFAFSDTSDVRLLSSRGVLAIVADGMGGMENGHVASNAATRTFLTEFSEVRSDEDTRKALLRALRAANDSVLQHAQEEDVVEEMGSTLVAVVVKDTEMNWVSVGDSRIYLLRSNELSQLTVDHVYERHLERAVAEGRISSEEARQDEQRNALTAYLGLRSIEEIDRSVRPFPLEAGDRVLLCSDGLYGTLSDTEITNDLRRHGADACHVLVNNARGKNKEKQDNITAVVLAFDGNR